MRKNYESQTRGIWVQSSDSKYFPSQYVYLEVSPFLKSPVIGINKNQKGKKSVDDLAFFIYDDEPHMQITKGKDVKVIPLWELAERVGY